MNRYFGLHTLEGELHALLPRYLLVADLLNGKNVLDVGCGTGIGATLLSDKGANRVEAIDHRPNVVGLAREKHDAEGVSFHEMFWEALDFEDDYFDAVLCLNPESPITDPNFLGEVRRVLKPNGQYIASVLRRQLTGMEDILPKYGYETSGQNISITDRDKNQTPQLGSLFDYFESAEAFSQAPQLRFTFSKAGSVDEEGKTQSSSKHSEDSKHFNDEFTQKRSNIGKIELLFAGPPNQPLPEPQHIEMPYFSLMERLKILLDELEHRQGPSSASFDTIIESNGEASDRETDTDNPLFGDTPLEPIDDISFDGEMIEEIESKLSSLREKQNDIVDELKGFQQAAREAINERDRYIDHLVELVNEWRDKYRQLSDAGSSNETETVSENDPQ